MELPRCPKHQDGAIYLKTGTKEGPSKGKTFVMCKGSKDCVFSREVEGFPVKVCPQHSETIDLHYVKPSGKGQYKCSRSKTWCGVADADSLLKGFGSNSDESGPSKLNADDHSPFDVFSPIPNVHSRPSRGFAASTPRIPRPTPLHDRNQLAEFDPSPTAVPVTIVKAKDEQPSTLVENTAMPVLPPFVSDDVKIENRTVAEDQIAADPLSPKDQPEEPEAEGSTGKDTPKRTRRRVVEDDSSDEDDLVPPRPRRPLTRISPALSRQEASPRLFRDSFDIEEESDEGECLVADSDDSLDRQQKHVRAPVLTADGDSGSPMVIADSFEELPRPENLEPEVIGDSFEEVDNQVRLPFAPKNEETSPVGGVASGLPGKARVERRIAKPVRKSTGDRSRSMLHHSVDFNDSVTKYAHPERHRHPDPPHAGPVHRDDGDVMDLTDTDSREAQLAMAPQADVMDLVTHHVDAADDVIDMVDEDDEGIHAAPEETKRRSISPLFSTSFASEDNMADKLESFRQPRKSNVIEFASDEENSGGSDVHNVAEFSDDEPRKQPKKKSQLQNRHSLFSDDRSSDASDEAGALSSDNESPQARKKDRKTVKVRQLEVLSGSGSEEESCEEKGARDRSDPDFIDGEAKSCSETDSEHEDATHATADLWYRKRELKDEIEKLEKLISGVAVNKLPDNGNRIRDQLREKRKELGILKEMNLATPKAKPTVVKRPLREESDDSSSEPEVLFDEPGPSGVGGSQTDRQGQLQTKDITDEIWNRIYSDQPARNRALAGQVTMERAIEARAVTNEAVERIHVSITQAPEQIEMEDPEGLLVPLMSHQRQALSWLNFRETQAPPGGILADEMGLGKTLSMISLILQRRKGDKEAIRNGEWDRKAKKPLLGLGAGEDLLGSCDTGRGPPDQELQVANCQSRTYFLFQNHYSGSVLEKIFWGRVILDEAHQIKNYKSQTAKAACKIAANARWCVTGTPVHNKLEEFYSLLKFLRCCPFDDITVFNSHILAGLKRKHVSDNNASNQRLKTLVKALLLRRMKAEVNPATGKPMVSLPEKKIETYELELSPSERHIYDRMFCKSRMWVDEYIKNQEMKEAGRMFTHFARVKDKHVDMENPFKVKSRPDEAIEGRGNPGSMDVLTMLLRLRQACAHYSLTKEGINIEALREECPEDGTDVTEKMANMSIFEDEEEQARTDSTLDRLFDVEGPSTKLNAVLKRVHDILESSSDHKVIIVSQWVKFLDIIEPHLKRQGIRLTSITGSVDIKDRTSRVESFNRRGAGPRVMLISLTAGGVGLNLIGANHLIFVDIHWNPALELQASDRIHRLGQTRDVVIHKFVCCKTIEEKVVELQEEKLKLAEGLLSGAGAKNLNKLSINDLKTLFDLNPRKEPKTT